MTTSTESGGAGIARASGTPIQGRSQGHLALSPRDRGARKRATGRDSQGPPGGLGEGDNPITELRRRKSMRIRRERHLACELLEEKTLLSGLSPLDTEALQEIASINNMGMFLSQLALLENVPAGVKQNASIVLTDGRNLDLSIHELASSKGTIVPSDIDSTDEPIAEHVLDEVGKSDF